METNTEVSRWKRKQKSVDGNENTSQLMETKTEVSNTEMETKTEVSRWKRKHKSVDGNENRSQLMETKTQVS